MFTDHLRRNSIFNYINLYPKIIKEGGWVFSGQVITAIINLIGIRIITEYLPANVLGEATMWMGVVVLLKNIFVQPFLNFQIRYYPEYQIRNKLLSFNSITFKIILVLFFASLILLSVGLIIFILFFHFSFNIILIIVILYYYIADLLKSFFINHISADRKQRTYATWIIIEAILMYWFAYLVIKNYQDTALYLLALATGTLLATYVFKDNSLTTLIKFKDSDLKINHILKEAYKFSLPFVPMALISWLMNLSSRYFIGIINNSYEVGIFVASFSIASRPFTMLSGVATNFLRPILLQAISKNERIKVKKLFTLWLGIVLIGGLVLMLLFIFAGSFIAEILLAESYRSNAAIFFCLIGFGYFSLAVYQVFENFLLSKNKTNYILYSTISGASTFLISNLIFVNLFAATGAAFSILISFSIQLLAIVFYYYFVLKMGKEEMK